VATGGGEVVAVEKFNSYHGEHGRFASHDGIILTQAGAGSGGRGPAARLGSVPRSPSEELREQLFEVYRRELAELEPNNRNLQGSISKPDWVPSEDDVRNLKEEVEWARREAADSGQKEKICPANQSGEDAPKARKDNPKRQDSPIWNGFNNSRNGRKESGQGSKKKYYEWDNTHNDIEVYDSKGNHKGLMDPVTGDMYKPPVPGRMMEKWCHGTY